MNTNEMYKRGDVLALDLGIEPNAPAGAADIYIRVHWIDSLGIGGFAMEPSEWFGQIITYDDSHDFYPWHSIRAMCFVMSNEDCKTRDKLSARLSKASGVDWDALIASARHK